MYTSIRRYRLVKGTPDLVKERADAEFLPQISALEGFISYSCIVTGLRGDGLPGIVTVSVFEHPEQARASSRMAADWARAMNGAFALEKVGEDSGRVVSHVGVGEPA
jgi:hypothetical protein